MTGHGKLPMVFRESFVLLLHSDEREAALRLLDGTLFSGVLAARAGDGASWLQREASGALGDLRQAIDAIADLGRWVDEAELSREEARLAIAAGDVAAALQPFADSLDAALMAYLASANHVELAGSGEGAPPRQAAGAR